MLVLAELAVKCLSLFFKLYSFSIYSQAGTCLVSKIQLKFCITTHL